MEGQLKLFLWEGVCWDWTGGVVFALAHDEDEAKRLIIEAYKGGGSYPKDCDFGHVFERREDVGGGKGLKDVGNKPVVIDEPFGFYLGGGA